MHSFQTLKQKGQGHFVKHVLTLMLGTSLSQAIAICASPVITRLYSPGDYGGYVLYLSIFAVLQVVVSLRYELAIVIPKEEEDARALLFLSVILVVSTCALLFFAAIFLGPISGRIPNLKVVGPWLLMLPFSLCLSGVYNALNYWHTRRKRFAPIAISSTAQSLAMVGTQIGTGVAVGASLGGLVLGHMAGQAISTFNLLRSLLCLEGSRKPNIAGMRKVAKEYARFPKFLLWGHVLNAIAPNLPTFVLATLAPGMLGLWGLAYRIMGAPISLIGGSMSQVFYSEAVKEKHEVGNCYQIYISTLKRLILFSFLIFVPPLVIPNSFFGLVFGHSWDEIGIVVKLLVPVFFFRFITSPTSSVFLIMNRQDLDLWFQLLFVGGSLASLIVGAFIGGGTRLILAYSVSQSVIYLTHACISFRLAKSMAGDGLHESVA